MDRLDAFHNHALEAAEHATKKLLELEKLDRVEDHEQRVALRKLSDNLSTVLIWVHRFKENDLKNFLGDLR